MASMLDNPVEFLQFVDEVTSQDTGGGLECDVLHLDDGTVLVISEDAIVLYPSISAWENSGIEPALGTIVRAAR